MATVKFEVNTDSESAGNSFGGSSSARPFRRTLHIITTIKLDHKLKDAFEQGAGEPARLHHDKDYDDLPKYMSTYLNDAQYLVATAGGSITFEAAKTALTNARFISIVGAMPGNVGACFGGVTMESIAMNTDRVDYLEAIGRPRTGIGLFCNRKSAMNVAEVANWAAIPGVNQNIAYGGNNAGGKNDANEYPANFAAIHASVTTLVISADPYFQNTKNKLIKAANNWIDGNANARYVCYPLLDYANVDGNHQPKTQKSSWYGPSLAEAYGELGKTAALVRDATSPKGFSDIVPTKGKF